MIPKATHRALLGALLEAAPDAMVIIDRAGSIMAANTECEKLFGFPRKELLGSSIETLVPERDRARHGAHRSGYFSAPRTRTMGGGLELYARRKDGTEFPVEISLSPAQTDEEGALVIAAIRDVGERKKIEAKFRGLLESAPDAMVIVDTQGRISLVNRQTEHLFGYGRAELIGQPVEKLVPERFRPGHPERRSGYFRNSRFRPMGGGLQLYAERKDGSEFPVEISLSPLETEEGTLVSAAIRDITERKEAYRRVEEANRLKTEFLASVSHELRTPLNAIIGFSELLYDEKLGPLQATHREYLGDVLNSARHLLGLINDILDLAKVEAGRMDFHPVRLDLAVHIQQACDVMRPQAVQRQVAMIIECASGPPHVVADPGKLKQILYNFLSNALKHSPEGGRIWVRTQLEPDDRYRIEVADEGPGLRDEDLPRLFAEFQRLSRGQLHPEGTGLGLAVTRRIVEAQGGEVGARNGERGAVFHAVLPRQMSATS